MVVRALLLAFVDYEVSKLPERQPDPDSETAQKPSQIIACYELLDKTQRAPSGDGPPTVWFWRKQAIDSVAAGRGVGVSGYFCFIIERGMIAQHADRRGRGATR